MAEVKLSPIIKSISGRLDNVVFYCRNKKQCARTYVIPRNPDTALQRIVRSSFAKAVQSWQRMSPDGKYAYTRKARNLAMSGYNLFISIYMKGKLIVVKEYKSACKKRLSLSINTFPVRIHSVSIPFQLATNAGSPVLIQEHG
ncbi:MAG: hypothetical protein JW864_15710 [Spirochaetes bacterium]|nr:hypothetical protein [Spirochaetota bacterium]